ncbi:MAG TPA: N-acetyltransferase, partial [Planococcus sp. (in: firmicutes)]|nr:N-acetyltransferase [Planococcus sp. (in: firmicutes)]
RVLAKLGLSEHSTLFGATTQDVSMLSNGRRPWREVESLESKKQWLDQLYVKTGAVFPFECYYPFPATADLFPEDRLAKWRMYENEDATRVLITKKDFKRDHYLQAIFPWSDLMDQPGLWETIASAHREMADEVVGEVFIWMDLTKETIQSLPENHQFKLPSPWILHGTGRNS